MSISGISGTLPPFVSAQTPATPKVETAQKAEGPGFAERINGAVKDLTDAQSQAAQSAKDYELGLKTDLASVMIDQQVASLGFQMALNVRNKALGAYRDIMNMPV